MKCPSLFYGLFSMTLLQAKANDNNGFSPSFLDLFRMRFELDFIIKYYFFTCIHNLSRKQSCFLNLAIQMFSNSQAQKHQEKTLKNYNL